MELSWIVIFLFLCLIDKGLATSVEGSVTVTYQYLNNQDYVVPIYNRYKESDPRRHLEDKFDTSFPPPPSLPPPPPNISDDTNLAIKELVYTNFSSLLSGDYSGEHPCEKFLQDLESSEYVTGPPRVVIQGPRGFPGRDGKDGKIGSPGLPGRRGASGSPGRMGLQGMPGEMGLTGLPGIQGPKGERGIIGPVGPSGDRGAIGRKGRRGKKGNQGETGTPGTEGPRGVQGETGPPGVRGPPGLPGQAASKGDPGNVGISGSRGRPGYPGPQGMPGQKGDRGEAGIPGMVIFPNAEAMYGVRLEGLIAYRSDVKQLYFRDHIKWRAIKISKCGDGVVDKANSEECDDGNDDDDDDCTTACKTAVCGDGVKHWYKEECDSRDFGKASCASWRPGWTGRLVCTTRCRISYHRCMYAAIDR